uniref:hypothetical protein n=1 Tax=Endozoicomonas acroporae TaxID=1701104 RepID=UPI0015E0BBB4
NTTAVNSKVETSGVVAYAGIGGGYVSGTVANTTAVNSTVETSGLIASAGIGGGYVVGTVAHTTAVDSRVETSGGSTYAGIEAGEISAGGTVANTTAVNSYVNGLKENSGSIANDQLLCQKADPRVLTANCSARTGIEAGRHAPHHVGRRSVGEEGIIADMGGSNAATATTAATMGITSASLLAAGGLGIAGYSTYQWITGYQEGLRGQELAMKPLTRGKELASAAVNSVSQGIQGIRERMNRQSVPTQEPAPE